MIAAEAFLAAAFLVLMVALIFLGGVSRVLGYPLNWSTDFATAFFAWACFLCADIAWRKDSLMAIELPDQPPAREAAGGLPDAQLLHHRRVPALPMTFGTWLAWTSRVRSFQGIPEISYSWVTMSLPVGAALLLITTFSRSATNCAGRSARESRRRRI